MRDDSKAVPVVADDKPFNEETANLLKEKSDGRKIPNIGPTASINTFVGV